jgi:hypothetical protein
MAALSASSMAGLSAAQLDMMAEHKAWQDEVKARNLMVAVNDPVTTGMFRPVTTYAVTSYIQAGVDEKVLRRRYSDFDWLYEVLRLRYTGIPVPNLPPKHSLVKGEEFIAARCAGLDSFLKECTKNPYLKDDTTFNSFLKSEETGGGWDALKKDALVKAKLPWGDREEAARWRKFLDTMSDQDDISAVVEVATSFADLLKSAIDTTLSKAKAYGDKSKTLAGGLDDLHKTWTSFHNITYDVADAGSSSADIVAHFKALSKSIEVSLMSTSVLGDIEMGRSTRMLSFFLETLKILRDKIVSLRNVLIKYAELQKKLKSARSAHNSAIASLESLEAKGKEDKDNKLHNAVDAKAKVSIEMEREVKCMEISVACVQIPTVLEEMRTEFRDKVVYFAKAEEAKEREQVEFWSEQMEKLGTVDPQSALENAREKLATIAPLDMWLEELTLSGAGGSYGSEVATELPESV